MPEQRARETPDGDGDGAGTGRGEGVVVRGCGRAGAGGEGRALPGLPVSGWAACLTRAIPRVVPES